MEKYLNHHESIAMQELVICAGGSHETAHARSSWPLPCWVPESPSWGWPTKKNQLGIYNDNNNNKNKDITNYEEKKKGNGNAGKKKSLNLTFFFWGI